MRRYGVCVYCAVACTGLATLVRAQDTPLRRAADLYRGDFMAGFTLRDSANFDDWQFYETEHLSREVAGALGRLVRGYSAQGDFEAAIGHARRWRAIAPFHI